ncbi:hypothetical protein ITP53_13865 [Nonomuraea sp. K274]|uniref:Carbohydrate ABC transporter substrate-binding protein (CUT1 family) n=1 Tax=Nonomuraea cypriaca TaxID=1187855 RepID=A0A931AB17_9ACTN|nr:hypothetical protein [Nonomuraea cypriaca]MBF8186809.1 hypothetical protein [Nonomuraea cypriaca]
MSLSRRGFLAAIPAAVSAGALAGCAGEPPLRVAVVWSGDELRRFLGVVRGYGPPVSVFSAGDDIGTLLRGPAEQAIPDVAVIPRLGLLRDGNIRTRVQPLPAAGSTPEFWSGLVSPGGGRVLGSWFKIAHKSLVWYREGASFRPPASLEAWRDAPGRLSVGAADGWVLCGWFENVLLARDPLAYDDLFTWGENSPDLWKTDAVLEALTLLAEIWRGGLDSEQGRRALTQEFHDSILNVFHYGTADVVAAPDFAWPVIARYGDTDVARSFRFPALAGRELPLVAGGDVAVAMWVGGQRAVNFVTWLTRPRGGDRTDPLEQWVGEGGFLTTFTSPDSSPVPLRERARELAQATNGRYALSDRMLGNLEGGDGRGLSRVLTELFSAVTVYREDPGSAARAARDKLVAAVGAGAL